MLKQLFVVYICVPDDCLNLLDRLGNENDLLLGRNGDGPTNTSTEKKTSKAPEV
jgi:hypothetical protein